MCLKSTIPIARKWVMASTFIISCIVAQNNYVGDYSSSDGLSGRYISLHTDSTFLADRWSDVVFEDSIDSTNSGTYIINADSLILKFNSLNRLFNNIYYFVYWGKYIILVNHKEMNDFCAKYNNGYLLSNDILLLDDPIWKAIYMHKQIESGDSLTDIIPIVPKNYTSLIFKTTTLSEIINVNDENYTYTIDKGYLDGVRLSMNLYTDNSEVDYFLEVIAVYETSSIVRSKMISSYLKVLKDESRKEALDETIFSELVNDFEKVSVKTKLSTKKYR